MTNLQGDTMEVVNFLEQLGSMVHYDQRIPQLINQQPDLVRRALAANDRVLLNELISPSVKNVADDIVVAAA
jgi:hypothetical protein